MNRANASPSEDIAPLCREAVDELQRAIDAPLRDVGKQVDHIQRLVVEVRDHLIDEARRAGGLPALAGDRRDALERANVALTLIAEVEYPPAGVQRKPLEQARDVLRALCE